MDRRNSGIPWTCRLLLLPVAILFGFGMVRLHYNLAVFEVWIAEDGLVEWATFAALAAMAAVAASHAAGLATAPARGWWIALAAAFAFGAFEEISWGQRVFGWHSPEWFLQHNAQDETNLHNLVIGGVKVNKLVFGKMLGVGVALYVLLGPVLYRRIARVGAFFDARTLPVPRNYQIVLILAAWLVSELARKAIGKAGEMQEFAVVFGLATVLLHPLNAAAQMPLAARLEAGLLRLGQRARQAARAWLSPRLRFLLLATALLVLEFGVFRLLFAAAFEPPGLVGPVGEVVWDRGVTSFHVTGPGLVSGAEVARAWQIGLGFDLRMALLILLPLALLSGIRPLDPARTNAARRGWLAYLALALAAAFLVYIADLGHYAYESERLNVGLLDHMRDAGTAAGMVWQTYPVAGIAMGLGLLVATTIALLAGALPAQAEPPGTAPARRRAVGTAAVLLYALALHGKWSQYPLRWSDAYFTANGYVAALASNPLQTVFDSWRSPMPSVDAAAACAAATRLAPHFGLAPCTTPPPSFARVVQPPAAGRPNVVVVLLESFSAYKTGVMGNPLDPSPQFDALARSSVLFTHFYSATRPTARSIFSMLFGIADVSPDRSASRNLRAVSQHTLLNVFAGYRKHYFIGGSASWGNIRGMLTHNVPDLRLHEGEYSDMAGNDVWGASDLHLLEQAHRVLAQEREPFVAFIQTAGNHRPYTIPDDARGFQTTASPETRLVAAGFDEPAAYDGMRFIDHALGHYLALARAAPYYPNTIFAFLGDHGSPARRFPPDEQQLRHLHVPLVLHGPRWLGAPRRIDTPASSLDLLPTLAGLAGVRHANTTLGRDLFAARPAEAQFAFLTHGAFRGLVGGGYFYAMDAAGRRTVHALRPDGSLEPEDAGLADPARVGRMAQLADAMHDSSSWLLAHNPPQASSADVGGR
ncbi:MAG: LTA synthase family protein [Nevskiaceae bacterium]